MKFRRNTAAGAASNNAVLASGEPGYTTDTHLFKIGDGVTAWNSLPQVGSATFARLGTRAALPRWQQTLETSPSTAVICIVGDSKSDEATSAAYMYARLRVQHTQPGEALHGMTSDVFTDGVSTNASKTYQSATANFTSADIGKVIFGTNITVGTTIASIDSTTQVQLSANATGNGSGLTFQLGRHIINRGNNGSTLAAWLADPTKLAALVADAPNLIIADWLTNDVRLGAITQVAARALLVQFITAVQAALPNTDILLRIPNAFLTADVSSLHYVQGPPGDGSNINPTGAAQSYSTLIRQAYLSLEGAYPNVAIADVQAEVFGTICRASHPLMADQLHPSPSGSTTNGNPATSGYTAVADYLASVIGAKRGGFVVDTKSYRVSREYLIYTAGNGFLDLGTHPTQGTTAVQFPFSTSDVLFVEGMAGPISLSGGTISRPFGNVVRITGLSGNDFTTFLGRTAVVAGNHPAETTGDRQIVSVDLPSTATLSFGTITAAVTGARTGALHDATSVLCTPPASFEAAGLYMVSCVPSANDTVRLVFYNPTGGTVDLAAANFAFWVVR